MSKTYEEAKLEMEAFIERPMKFREDTKEEREQQPLTQEQKERRQHLKRLLSSKFDDKEIKITLTVSYE